MPTTTHIKSPIILQFGLTWLLANGYFLGAATSWNMAMSSRDTLGAPVGNEPRSSSDGDNFGGSLRIGYHFGSSRTRTVEPPPRPPLPPVPPREITPVLPPEVTPALPPEVPPVPPRELPRVEPPVPPVRPLALTLSLTSSTVVAGKPASFAVAVTGATALPRYVLDTGDGSAPQVLRAPTVTHTYPRAGVFRAAVSLAAGESGTGSSVAVTVVAAPLPPRPRPTVVVPPPTLVLRLTSSTVVAGEPASFAVSVEGAAALPPFVLDAGDGSASEPLRTATFTHAYPRAGVFRAAVSLPAGVPGTGSSVAVTVVVPPPPVLTVTLTSSTVVSGEPASFAVSVEGTAAIPPYVLDAGDGSAPQSLRAATFTHVYRRAGVFRAVVSLAPGVPGVGSSVAVTIASAARWNWPGARWLWLLVITLVAIAGLLAGRRGLRRSVVPTLHPKPDHDPHFPPKRHPDITLEVHAVQNLASLQFTPPTKVDREP